MNKKIAVVTGATRGIGANIAKLLNKENFTVIANYFYNQDEAEKFQKDSNIEIMKWNVADFNECDKAIKQIEEKYQQTIDILVNNAGITKDKMMHKMTFEEWSDVLKVNLYSCFNMSRAVINQMRQKNFGRIINISSVNALAGCAGQTNYCSTKAGIIGFTKSLALESASKNITINAIAPGYTETKMVQQMSEEILTKIKEKIPIKRLTQPEEIAQTVLFLINSPAITGATINVNGGYYMQ